MNPIDFFSFKGRMRRKHFVVAFVIAGVLLLAISAGWQMTHIKAIILSRYLVPVAFLPSCVRRIHDIGFSGWFTIPAFIVPLLLIPLLVLPGFPHENKYGANPRPEMPADVPEES